MIVLLLVSLATSAMADEPPDALLEELYFGEVARVQEKGEFQLTLSVEKPSADPAETGLELEFGLTDRLQVSVETPVSQGSSLALWDGDEVEIGAAWDLLPGRRGKLLTGLDVVASDPSLVELKLVGGWPFPRGEIHSAVTVNLGDERQTMLDLAGVYAWSRWRGSLELRHESGEAGSVWITPGLSFMAGSLQIGAGIGLPSSGDSDPLLVFKAAIEF